VPSPPPLPLPLPPAATPSIGQQQHKRPRALPKTLFVAISDSIDSRVRGAIFDSPINWQSRSPTLPTTTTTTWTSLDYTKWIYGNTLKLLTAAALALQVHISIMFTSFRFRFLYAPSTHSLSVSSAPDVSLLLCFYVAVAHCSYSSCGSCENAMPPPCRILKILLSEFGMCHNSSAWCTFNLPVGILMPCNIE